MSKLDFHVHFGEFPLWGLRLDLARWQAACRRHEVELAVGLADFHSGDNAPEANQRLFALAGRLGNVLPFHWINPRPDCGPDYVARQLAFILASRRLIHGLKFHPSISQVAADDPRLAPLWELAHQEGWIVLVHAGRSPISSPDRVVDLARRWPGAAWVIAHLGGQTFDRVMDTLNLLGRSPGLENLFLDTSQTTHPDLLKRAADRVGGARLLFGSDEPFLSLELVIACHELAGLADPVLERIYGQNARELLAGRSPAWRLAPPAAAHGFPPQSGEAA